MSKSRLEKFLYALYSLDSSDLPTPLSRIEELYKCWVTGEEAPSFEPISRVEKYLMAILGVYDVDSLPNPLSRVEVLLYKLATGDDNLDDVETFLSEHEELLAEIIRNGGAGGNINIEYVLYTLSTEHNTLYNTAEKPVKSAFLKGNTLVNLHKLEKYSSFTVLLDEGWKQHFGNNNSYATWRMFDVSMLKPNTDYGVFCWVSENTLSETYWECHVYNSSDTVFNATSGLRFNAGETGMRFGKLTTISDFTGKTCGIRHVVNINTPSTEYVKFRCVLIEYQDGMENWDIPYFEGMQSVKMPVLTTTGKNLFDVSRLPQSVSIIPTSTGYTLKSYSCSTNIFMSDLFPNLIVGKKYVLSFQSSSSSTEKAYNSIGFYNLNTSKLLYYRNNESFTLTNEMYYERSVILYGVTDEITEFSNVQLEEGLVATEYEPYKTNILSTSEDVILRGIGNVQDTLDCLTGELTQRVGEVVLDGNAGWREYNGNYYVSAPGVQAAKNFPWGKVTILSNLYPSFIGEETDVYIESDWNGNQIKIRDLNLSLEELKSKLMTQPLVATYISNEESVKIVDLSVVDQDGNDTKLSTFDDITHVTLSSEGLIPEAELEVATKNEEVLNTMSLEMDDISTTQNALKETSNTQSENVDATMIATTEIYEELL